MTTICRWLLAAALLAACDGSPKFKSTDITGAEYGKVLELTDQNGKLRHLEDFRGKAVVLFFGFTHCPDICPTTLADVANAVKKLGPDAERVQVLFVSVDPERDTPEKLATYVKNFDLRLVGLTGTPEEIAAVARAYKVYYAKVPNKENSSDYTMDHTSIIYVMDPKGEFVTHFTPSTSVDELASRLDKLLS